MADGMEQLKLFVPSTPEEQTAKQQAIADWQSSGESVLFREADHHFTASALVMDPTLRYVLMVHHNLYHTFAWPGGHVDGSPDFLSEALREVKEETGIETVWPVSGSILSLDVLPVPRQKKGETWVPAHHHYSVGFGCIAPKEQALQIKPDENSAVEWIPFDQITQRCGEPHMEVIYRKIQQRMAALLEEKQACVRCLPERLIPWYRINARKLPWREDKDPYHVWVSEIMLQQTRVEAVKGYYARFLQSFPTIESLAVSREEKLLKLWEGLGYYNRARNLQKTAICVCEQYGGHFPTDYETILSLPGIGAYTAGAIGSICFEQPTPAVDGNVLRVLARLTETYVPIDTPALKKQITNQLAAVYPAGECGDFTQSLMELGATVCVPNGQPKCGDCPLADVCLANRAGTQQLLPVKKKKQPRRVERKTVFVLQCGDRIAVEKRREKGVLSGLWQFPNASGDYGEKDLPDLLERYGIKSFSLEKRVERKHIFTHIEWEMTCYYLHCDEMVEPFVWVTEKDLDHTVALPAAFRLFWEE